MIYDEIDTIIARLLHLDTVQVKPVRVPPWNSWSIIH